MITKLLILPHAGGSSLSYQEFRNHLPETVSLFLHDYPGHGRRSSEPLLDTMENLVADLTTRAESAGFCHKNTDWAIFGHSMGAVVAHAFIQKRIRQHLCLPAAFFASGARPPMPSSAKTASVPLHGTALPKPSANLPKDLFWAKMAGYGGIPEEISTHPEIQDHFEQLLKLDFQAIETHTPDTIPMDVPIHVFYGDQDRHVVACLKEWSRFSVLQTRFYPFDGGHFFVLDHLPQIGEIMGRTLSGNF
jgi:surfactin synthase thioesterase subunit